eukprot:7379657-Prymnesium_polylepis.1
MLILSLVHGRRASAWPSSCSGSCRRNFMQATLPTASTAPPHSWSAEDVPPRVARSGWFGPVD